MQTEPQDLIDIAAPGAAEFTALMLVEGLETSDGRLFEIGTTSWRPLPLPFMVRDTAVHGPNEVPAPTWAAGQIDIIYRDPNDPTRILGRGHLMPNAVGERAAELMAHSFRGVSIDGYGDSPVPPEQQTTVVDQNGTPAAVLTRFADTVISGLTMVPTPALEACCAWMDGEQEPAITMEAHGAVLDPDQPPEVVMITDPYERLVASGGGPVNPPREWFFTPEPGEYQPMQVTAEGHVTGHLARKGQCHIAYVGTCETAPVSNTSPPFKAFHRTAAACDDGDVTCGWLAIQTKHKWDPNADAQVTADHYDHTGTLVAKVRASNGKYGTWLSGALSPGLTDHENWVMQAPEVSGDWRTFVDPENGRKYGRELVAALGVPFPGFPGTRPEVLVASGEIVAQHGVLDPCDCDEETMMEIDNIGEVEQKTGEVILEPSIVASAVGAEDARYADALLASMDDPVVALSVQEQARWFAKYDTKTRKKMADAGTARPDGSYAIADEEDLKKAIAAVGDKGSNADRKHIMRQAKALKKAALIPSTWQWADGSIKS